jgi:hypothetical protein
MRPTALDNLCEALLTKRPYPSLETLGSQFSMRGGQTIIKASGWGLSVKMASESLKQEDATVRETMVGFRGLMGSQSTKVSDSVYLGHKL